MTRNDKLQEAKRRASEALLALTHVSGVGISGGKLAIYVTEDSPAVRDEVLGIVHEVAPSIEATFVVTGMFEKQ